MKTFPTIIMLLLISFSLKAQQQTNITYLIQPDLKRFAGEWQYASNDTVFALNLKLVKTYVKVSGGVYIDLIYGDYTIKKADKYCNHLLNVALFIQEDMWIKV